MIDRVEQTYKQVAEKLQVELDQTKRHTSAIEAAVLRRVADSYYKFAIEGIQEFAKEELRSGIKWAALQLKADADRIEKGARDD